MLSTPQTTLGPSLLPLGYSRSSSRTLLRVLLAILSLGHIRTPWHRNNPLHSLQDCPSPLLASSCIIWVSMGKFQAPLSRYLASHLLSMQETPGLVDKTILLPEDMQCPYLCFTLFLLSSYLFAYFRKNNGPLRTHSTSAAFHSKE